MIGMHVLDDRLRDSGERLRQALALWGAGLLVTALIIIAVPEIVGYLVATLVLAAALVALTVSSKMKK